MSGRRLLAALAVVTLGGPVLPVWAQEGKDAAAPVPVQRQPRSLQEVVDEIVWKSDQQGLLLIVAPATIRRQVRPIRQPNGEYTPSPPVYLPPKSPQGLRLAALEQYFPASAVPVRDVTVFAPSMMSVLNYDNLPKPSAFAGFQPSDSFQLLQGSLTKNQWQQVSSTNGLGLSDLDAEQRELFLASFPATMQAAQSKNGETTTSPLSDNQRRGIRFRVVRTMDWYFRSDNGGGIGVGRDNKTENQLVITEPQRWESDQRKAFGAELLSEVPARYKPSQLNFDWEALDRQVDLTDVKTVGDVVKRVQEATRVELFCDPRYATLPVYIRGDQARAGNILKALARGVTGTWRRLENTYVLTNDIVGLGVQHARIIDWINQNVALGSVMDRKIAASMRDSKPGQYLTYDSEDPYKPSDKFLEKYTAHQKSLRAPRKEGDPVPDYNRLWSVAELPPAAQEQIRKQVADFAAGRYGEQDRNINKEAVSLTVNSRVMVSIPGIGVAEAPLSTSASSYGDEAEQYSPTMPKLMERPMPPQLKVRALVISLRKEENAAKIAQAARRAGFTELWLDPVSTMSVSLPTVLQAAHRANLKVRVMVPALRQKPTKDSKSADINILGETYTQYADRLLQSGAWPPTGWGYDYNDQRANPVSPAELIARRQREQGDWINPTIPDAAAMAVGKVREIAKVPSLDGVVLSDLSPPGYESVGSNSFGPNLFRDTGGGYTPTQRLAFLRRYGVDPVDLSADGDDAFNRYSGLRFRQRSYIQMTLPLFPSEGANTVTATADGKSVNTAKQWGTFRQEELQKTVKTIQERAQAAAGDVPVWFYQNTTDAPMYSPVPFFVENRDKSVDKQATPESGTPAQNLQPGGNPFQPNKAARAESSVMLVGIDMTMRKMVQMMPNQPNPTLPEFFRLMASYMFDPKNGYLKDWDGIVLDATVETNGDVLTLLDGLPEDKAIPVAPPTVKPAIAAPKPAKPPRPKRP